GGGTASSRRPGGAERSGTVPGHLGGAAPAQRDAGGRTGGEGHATGTQGGRLLEHAGRRPVPGAELGRRGHGAGAVGEPHRGGGRLRPLRPGDGSLATRRGRARAQEDVPGVVPPRCRVDGETGISPQEERAARWANSPPPCGGGHTAWGPGEASGQLPGG